MSKYLSYKYILFFLFLFIPIFIIPNNAQAAATDCVQTHSDGKINCVNPVKDYWEVGVGGTQYPTFSQARAALVYQACTGSGYVPPTWGCGEKTSVGDIDGRYCLVAPPSSPYCSDVTNVVNNKTGNVYIYVYADWWGYYQTRRGQVTHKYTCATGQTLVNAPSGGGSAWCKPYATTQTVNLQCANTAMATSYINPPAGSPAPQSCKAATQGDVSAGDPVSATSGNRSILDSDYVYKGAWPLGYTRIYNNKLGNWSSNWNYSLVYSDYSPSGKIVVVNLPNGASWAYKYNITTSAWEKDNATDDNKLSENATTGEFTYTLDNNTKIIFQPNFGTVINNDNSWWAKKVIVLGNGEYNLSYNAQGILTGITNPNNISLTINNTATTTTGCNIVPFVSSVVGPGGTTVSYTYDTSCRLTKVIYPDTSFKSYTYTGGYNIATEQDEANNVLFSVATSTSTFKTTSEGMGATGAINKVSMTYNSTNTVVTDALAHASTIGLTTINEQTKPTSYSTLCTWCQGMQGSSISYNTNGYITSVTDFNGNITNFTYDTVRNLMTQAKQSVNNSLLTRQTDITYDTNWRLPLTITEPSGAYISGTYNNRITTNTYDPITGRLTQKDITAPLNDGTTNTSTKTWRYYYDSLGQLTSIENPMYVSGVYNDKTTMTYNSNGQVTSVSNGLGQTITMSSFDNFGNPQLITYPDSTSLGLTYNSRGNVIAMTKNNVGSTSNFLTTLTRDARQLVTKSTTPSGAYKEYVYDLTQRLTEIKEYDEGSTYQGKTVFTLDNMSKVTKIQVLNASSVEIRLTTKQYNNKNMLYKDLTALAYATTYTYDANGNLTNINDANNKNLTYTYDSLNRIATQTNPDTGVITNTYNPDDSIASITDPKSLTTSYTYNGFGETIKLDSPDTGVSTNTRNLSGDITSSTDAKSITANYTYDVLHRPTNIDYPGSSEDVAIVYDSCTNGIGKICTISDITGSTTYTYDDFARISSKNYTNGLFSRTVSYSYDSFSRLSKITYPSGMEINYTYSNNKPVTASYTVGGVTTNIITNGMYDPFDRSLKSYNYGDTINGVTYTNTINKDGLVSNIATSVATNVNKAYTFDTRLNITGINGGSTPVNAVSSYDFNSRITNFNYGSGVNNSTYSYNTSGDRTSTLINSVTNTYTTSSTSHRLDSLSGGTSESYTYDNNGSQTASTGKTFTYNNAGRMSDYSDSTNNFSYLFNSMGQRVKKIDNNNSSNNIWYIYDESGQLIAEYDNSGNVINEYVYINGAPIALLRSSNLYYIYPDHLGTPRTITDTANNPVWTWENTDPFGNNLPNDTVSGSIFTFNLRLPGQYFDNESKLNYNYFRDYNSMLGRYIQSDPIGLSGGINTFGYVGGNSLSGIDSLGLLVRLLIVESHLIGYGHAALEVNGKIYGIYPTASDQKTGRINFSDTFLSIGRIDKTTTAEFVDFYKGQQEVTHAYTLNFSKEMELDLENNLNGTTVSKNIYSLSNIYGQNCVGYVENAINKSYSTYSPMLATSTPAALRLKFHLLHITGNPMVTNYEKLN